MGIITVKMTLDYPEKPVIVADILQFPRGCLVSGLETEKGSHALSLSLSFLSLSFLSEFSLPGSCWQARTA